MQAPLILYRYRMKVLLFTLVRAFEFELGVRPEDLMKSTMIVQRPVVKYEQSKGTQLPLKIRAVKLD